MNCRRYEESGSFKNLDEYKTIRGIAWLYNKAGSSRKKTIEAFMQKTGCTKETAENYLCAARKNRGIVSIYDTVLRESDNEFDEDFDEDTNEDAGEDLSREAGGTYGAILWGGSWEVLSGAPIGNLTTGSKSCWSGTWQSAWTVVM